MSEISLSTPNKNSFAMAQHSLCEQTEPALPKRGSSARCSGPTSLDRKKKGFVKIIFYFRFALNLSL
jgi:hypothetical protein